jgi:phage I-like protein
MSTKKKKKPGPIIMRCEKGDTTPRELPQGDGPPAEFMIMPRPEFQTSKGTFKVDDKAVKSIMAEFVRHGNELVVDFEHQTFEAERNGQPAPAAGWIKGLEAREDGIYAVKVTWTETAAKHLGAREYRYHSPTFTYDERTKRVLSIETESLTNYPASRSQVPLAAKDDGGDNINPNKKGDTMEKLLYALSAEDEDTAIVAVETMKKAAGDKDSEIATLKATAEETDTFIKSAMEVVGCEDRAAFVGAIKAHKDEAAKVAELTKEVTQYKTDAIEAEKAALIEAANLGEDKTKWLETQPLETVKSYLETCGTEPEVTTGTPQSTEAKKDDSDGTPEDWFVSMKKGAGLDDEAIKDEWTKYVKHKKANPIVAYPEFPSEPGTAAGLDSFADTAAE